VCTKCAFANAINTQFVKLEDLRSSVRSCLEEKTNNLFVLFLFKRISCVWLRWFIKPAISCDLIAKLMTEFVSFKTSSFLITLTFSSNKKLALKLIANVIIAGLEICVFLNIFCVFKTKILSAQLSYPFLWFRQWMFLVYVRYIKEWNQRCFLQPYWQKDTFTNWILLINLIMICQN